MSLNIGFIGEAYGNVGALATNNSAYKKSALFRIGGFDEMLITGEDVDLSWKLELGNYNIQFDKNFIVYHQYRSTIKEFIKEQVNYGVGRTLLINRYPSKFSIFEKHIRILPYITFVYFLFLFLIIFHSMQLFIIVIILGILLVLSFTFGRRYLILNKLLRNEGIFTVLKCLPLFLLIDYANIRGIFFNKLN